MSSAPAPVVDILLTSQTRRCQVLQMLKFSKAQHHLIVSEAVIEQHERAKKKGRKKIDPDKLLWKPPTFSRFVSPFPAVDSR